MREEVNGLLFTALLLFMGVVNLAAQTSFTVELGTTERYKIDKQDNIVEYLWQAFSDYNLTTHATTNQVILTTLDIGRENEIEVSWKSLGTYYLTVFVISDKGCLNKMGFIFNVISSENIVAVNDTISVLTCDTQIINILDNDIYNENTSISIIGEPNFGSSIVNANGTISYTANCNYIGSDTLTYKISDGKKSDTASVIIAVESYLTFNSAADCIEKVPHYSWDLSVLGIQLSSIDIKLYDSEGSLIEFIENASFNGSNEWPGYDSNVEFYPYGVNNRQELIRLEVDFNSEYFENRTDTLTLPDCIINTVVAEWDTVSVFEQETIIKVLLNDFDPDEGIIDISTLEIGKAPLYHGPFHGDAVVNTNGTITYTPDEGYAGVDSFVYIICDNYTRKIACDTAIVKLKLFSNKELVAVDDYFDLNIGEKGILDISKNDIDPERELDLTSIEIITDPENGTVSANNDGTVTYQPASGYEGLDSFQYVICDLGIPKKCDDAWVYINIVENNCVVAFNDVAYTFVMEEINIAVLDNDIDFENEIDSSSIMLMSSANHGNVYIQNNHTITYIPYEVFVGVDSFTYRIFDQGYPVCSSNGIVYVNIIDKNEEIVVVNDKVTTPFNENVNIEILANDYDPDGSIDTSTVTIIENPVNGSAVINNDGSLSYNPNDTFVGLDSLIYKVCDDGIIATCNTAIVYITVSKPDNIPPVASNDYVNAIGGIENVLIVSGNDYDPDGELDTLSLLIVDQPTWGTIVFDSNTGLLTYTTTACIYSDDSFTYMIYDLEGMGSNVATVNIYISIDQNLDSDLDGIPDVAEDKNGNRNFCDDDTDGDGIPDYLDTDDDDDCIATVDEDLNSDGNYYNDDLDGDGIPNFLDDDQDGDGILGCDENQDINENGVNDANENWNSRAVDDIIAIVFDNESVIPVLDNDSTTMIDSTIYIVGEPYNGYVTTNNVDWNFVYRPNIDFVGVDSFLYEVCDYYGMCDTAKVVITIEDRIIPPHLFTPNGDGQHDYYVIEGLEEYPNNEFVVYNRWGNKVFEYTGYYNEWDGSANVKGVIGENKLPGGVYYYVLHYGVNRKKAGALFLER